MYRFTRILIANYRRISNIKSHIEFKPKKLETPAKFLISSSILSYFGAKKSEEEVDKEQEALIMTIKRGVLSSLRSEFDKAEQLYHLALRSAQTMKDEKAITYIYDLLANLAYETGKLSLFSKIIIPNEFIF